MKRAPSPTKRKDRSEEKSKDRSKDKAAAKELSEKDRGRDKTRKRRSASSGSSSTRWVLLWEYQMTAFSVISSFICGSLWPFESLCCVSHCAVFSNLRGFIF